MMSLMKSPIFVGAGADDVTTDPSLFTLHLSELIILTQSLSVVALHAGMLQPFDVEAAKSQHKLVS